MKRLGLMICLLTAVFTIFLILLIKEAVGGTPEELYAIAEKYLENPMVIKNHGDHACAYILNKEKTQVVATDVRTLDLQVCLYFFELKDGVMTLVWTNPVIEQEEKKLKEKNQV